MLKDLKFVQGAVSTKDFIPEMKHFVIRDGHVRAYNGVIGLSSPIDFAVDCKPQAASLVHAIANCEDVVSLAMTAAGRLRIQSGKFKALIKCIEEESLHPQPSGQTVAVDGEAMYAAVCALSKFVGNDASRAWANGILFRGQSAFATNNVCLVEYWLGVDMPFTANVPMKAINEMMRIKQPPTHVQIDPHSMTFHYESGRWLRTQLYDTEWPPLEALLDKPSSPQPIPQGLFEGLATVKPFLDKAGYVHFHEDTLRTHVEEEEGASYAVEGLTANGIYTAKMLALLEGVATTADFHRYPEPVAFFGERLRGLILGVRL